MQYLNNIQKLISQYDGFILDLWGVVHDGIAPYHGAIEALQALQAAKKTVIFMSNAPRTVTHISSQLRSMGVSIDGCPVLTSGEAVRYYLKTNDRYNNVYHICTHDQQNFLDDLGIQQVTDLQVADCIVFSYFINSATEDVSQCDAIFEEAIALKLPLLCSNSDRLSMHGNIVRFCAGTFAARYESMGGTVQYFGKPHLPVYQEAFAEIFAPRDIPKEKIIMIGDTIETDIAGANNFGIDSAYIKRREQDLSNVIPTWELHSLRLGND